MRMVLAVMVVAAGCTNDIDVQVTLESNVVRISLEHDLNYFPLVMGCDDPGDSYDSTIDPPDCLARYRLTTADGEFTGAGRGDYTFAHSGLGGVLEMKGCGVDRVFQLPDTIPTMTNPVATRDGDDVTITFDAPADSATHYSARRQSDWDYRTCTVAGDKRAITISDPRNYSIDLVARIHYTVDNVFIESRSERIDIEAPQ